jgi:hypothetical protein
MNASNTGSRTFLRHVTTMAVISVCAWAAFLTLFRTLWPEGYEPSSDRRTVLVWWAVGTLAVVASFHTMFRLFRTPRQWRTSAAIALSAPAFCLDAVATTYFHDWFPGAGPADNDAYAALILGTVGVALLATLVAPDA